MLYLSRFTANHDETGFQSKLFDIKGRIRLADSIGQLFTYSDATKKDNIYESKR